jgi:hypothetical protein
VALDRTSCLSRAREHIEMALRLRSSACKLRTSQAQAKLTQLASLYEQLSLCYLEESCVAPRDRRIDIRTSTPEVVTEPAHRTLRVAAGSRSGHRH